MAEALRPELVREFVGEAHKDLEKVKFMLEAEPALLHAAMNWGGEDWETALGAAAHVGRKDIALWLLSKGARLDLFAAAMMGELEVVQAALERHPEQLHAKGPHGISLLQHALIGGGPDSPVVQYLKSQASSPAMQELHQGNNNDNEGSNGMILVENRIEVKSGMAEGILERFRKPKTVHTFPGFIRMDVLHAKVNEETEEIRVCTVWEKEDDFHNWSNSESFRHAHAKRAESSSSHGADGAILGNRITLYTVEATHLPAKRVEA